jgi:hypothetical protein
MTKDQNLTWELAEREERDGIAWDIVDASTREIIARDVASPPRIYGESPRTIRARILAAAPELLEAAKNRLAECKRYGGCQDSGLLTGEYCSDECSALASAISKAEGHQ